MKFDTITDALKWCIDHPNQKLTDKDGREIWFSKDIKTDSALIFETNIDTDGNVTTYSPCNLFPSDLQCFDLPTLSPKKTEPEKPTLNNLAALENWDWFWVTLPGGQVDTPIRKHGDWTTTDYITLRNVLSAGWPVEFGRDEA